MEQTKAVIARDFQYADSREEYEKRSRLIRAKKKVLMEESMKILDKFQKLHNGHLPGTALCMKLCQCGFPRVRNVLIQFFKWKQEHVKCLCANNIFRYSLNITINNRGDS